MFCFSASRPREQEHVYIAHTDNTPIIRMAGHTRGAVPRLPSRERERGTPNTQGVERRHTTTHPEGWGAHPARAGHGGQRRE